MINSLLHSYFRTTIGLLLLAAFTLNTGYQYSTEALSDPIKMDICDHTDSEKECDNKEKGETDDIIKPEPRVPDLCSLTNNDQYLLTQLNQLSNHLETPTPPPEYPL